jgi:hypothetical protein
MRVAFWRKERLSFFSKSPRKLQMHKQLEQATALEEGDGISIPPPIPIEALLHAHNHEACILSENLVFVVRNRAAPNVVVTSTQSKIYLLISFVRSGSKHRKQGLLAVSNAEFESPGWYRKIVLEGE